MGYSDDLGLFLCGVIYVERNFTDEGFGNTECLIVHGSFEVHHVCCQMRIFADLVILLINNNF